ncbi:hypothetical protein BGZ58_000766 [Dissophora ornata]|nr:hypothetical protein BGZ58_000766 [Dissophora ornata]
MIQPCEAAPRSIATNQRVDAPSPDDFLALTGPNFAYTQQTPLGSLQDARQYADGALATQKLVAGPIIPVDRQLWVGVDTRTAYFGNNFGGDKIANVTQLLQAGMRRLVIDLWWDGTDLGWQLCPRFSRNGSQLSTVRMALVKERKELEASMQLRGMGNNQTVSQGEASLEPDVQQEPEDVQSPPTQSPSPSIAINIAPQEHDHESDPGRNPDFSSNQEGELLEKRASVKAKTAGLEEARDRHSGPAHHSTGASKPKSASTTTAPDKVDDKNAAAHTDPRRQRHRQHGHEWFRKKKPPQRPAIKPKGLALDSARRSAEDNKTASSPPALDSTEFNPFHEHRGGLHRLAMSKGIVSSYDKAAASDQTVDGITCSTGEDVIMLLQSLQTWIQQTSEGELEDVLVIVLNLNELGNNSLGSRSPIAPQPTPSPPINGTNTTSTNLTALSVSDEDFFKAIISPNTNKTVKALLPNVISLKELFTDAFPSLIYSPAQLQMDRVDLEASWWKDGPVGLDYYNTTTDPVTGKTQSSTGWPTSNYLIEAINRRIIVGIGANNLPANTTYNVTDDLTTLYGAGFLGPSMTNSSLLRVSSALSDDLCGYPMPGVMMVPTGTEESTAPSEAVNNGTDPITTEVTWSFASMSDSDLSPWLYSSGQLAHTAMTIWSWDLDQPPLNQTRSRDRRCGAMQSNGRWAVQNCNLKLPVACRQTDTSGKWMIYEKGAGNYRDVTCPEGYSFDVPRTARENQLLYKTLLSYWNETSPSFYKSLMALQRKELNIAQPVHAAIMHHKRRHREDPDHDSSEYEESDDGTERGQHGRSASSPLPWARSHRMQGLKAKEVSKVPSTATVVGGTSDGGMIWIDISSWQTAGCWVPGGVHGICPYQDPDNTVALQEIIKVSTIGGVIILVLVGIFLYVKCRRNVRLRKTNKRRTNVRNKIMRTEVETVPA